MSAIALRSLHQPLPTTDDALLTFKEAMSYLRVSRSKLYLLIASGQLTAYKVGNMWRFYRTDLRACVQRTIIHKSA